MPRFVPSFLRIDDRSGNLIELIPLDTPGGVQAEIVHETREPGGFWTMTVDISTTDSEYLQWRDDRLLYVATVEAGATKTVWTGRLEDIDILRPGITRLTFRGDWSKFQDAVNNNQTYTKAYTTGALDAGDEIIQDMVDSGFHADTDAPSISSLEAPGHTIVQTYPVEWNLWQTLTDPRRGVLSYANSSSQKMDMTIYENGIVYAARNPSVITWRTFIDPDINAIDNFPLKLAWKPVANAVDALYSGGSITTPILNQSSIDDSVRKERTLSDIGTSGATTADARAEDELTQHGERQQQITGFEVTRVWDVNNVEQPLCDVRAGDVIYVQDLFVNSLNLGTVALDALRTFVVEETRCDHRKGSLLIRPDRPDASFRNIFQLNRIRSTV